MESGLTPRKKRLREKLLAFGSINAKKKGLSSLTIDKLMRGVGRTGSVFYTVFDSRNDMVAALIQRELDRSEALLINGWSGKNALHGETHLSESAHIASSLEDWLEGVLYPYVSMAHVADAESGCALPILCVEIARGDRALRRRFESAFNRIAEEWSATSGCSSETALALLAQCVGAVMIARAMDTEKARVTLLRATNALTSETFAKKAQGNNRKKAGSCAQ